MEVQHQADSMEESSSSSLGWPFGLPTCMVIHTPNSKEFVPTPLAFHQQFMNLQTTFLLPFYSDADVSSSSDTDSRSEAASSFFKDSRRITLGTLIGLPMDNSFRALHPDAHYHVFAARRRTFLPSCGILELLGCVRNSTSNLHELALSEDGVVDEAAATANSNSTSLAAYLQIENANPSDAARVSVLFEDAVSNGSRSPDWNDQFVSCHSILSDGEWTGADAAAGNSHVVERIATPKSTPRHKSSTPRRTSSTPQSQKMQRSSSMKSFFSSICCRTDAVERR